MNKRKNLGQHFLKSKTIAKDIVSSAKITRNDVVLEIGTGHGILIPYLCKNAKQVFSIENDQDLYLSTKSNFHDYPNLVLEYGDGFDSDHNFKCFYCSNRSNPICQNQSRLHTLKLGLDNHEN